MVLRRTAIVCFVSFLVTILLWLGFAMGAVWESGGNMSDPPLWWILWGGGSLLLMIVGMSLAYIGD